jgi:hypothetical protein
MYMNILTLICVNSSWSSNLGNHGIDMFFFYIYGIHIFWIIQYIQTKFNLPLAYVTLAYFNYRV